MGEDLKPIPGSRALIYDPRIVKSIQRLRTMGLKVHVEAPNPNTVIIAVDIESIIRYITRHVARNVSYNKKITGYNKENQILLVIMWKGDKPSVVEELESKLDYKVEG
jgi:hypothetical protein